MLSKSQRLQLREIPTFFDEAARKHSPFFTVFYRLTSQEVRAAFTVIVPKKHFAKATQRNQIRRQVVAALQEIGGTIGGLEAAVVVKPLIASLEYSELKTELSRVFSSLQRKA